MLIYNKNDIGGNITKKDERYVVKDNTNLNNLVLSNTKLHPGKKTSGHVHPGQEEIYFFVSGSGLMIVDDEEFKVTTDDIILIPDGKFHQVINTNAHEPLVFNCVFNGIRNH